MNIDAVIRDDWASEPGVVRACLQVWYALSAKEYQLDHYTFGELAEYSKESDESLISKALLYLASPKMKILNTCLMYEFNGNFFELPDEEVSRYSKGELVIHPEIGDPISDSEILFCFVPGENLRIKGVE